MTRRRWQLVPRTEQPQAPQETDPVLIIEVTDEGTVRLSIGAESIAFPRRDVGRVVKAIRAGQASAIWGHGW